MTTLTIEHLNNQIDQIFARRKAERALKDKPEPGFQDLFGRTHRPAKRDSERGQLGARDGTLA